jgi:hypothetical protein
VTPEEALVAALETSGLVRYPSLDADPTEEWVADGFALAATDDAQAVIAALNAAGYVVAQVADAELGAAWRRAQEALPEGAQFKVDWQPPEPEDDYEGGWMARCSNGVYPENPRASRPWSTGEGSTPTAALDALTAALRERSA